MHQSVSQEITITMKNWFRTTILSIFATLAITSVYMSAIALDRTVIADKAENVTPILIGNQAPNVTVKTADGSPVSLQ